MRLKSEEIKELPKIPREKVKYLWYSDYWDGIRSGMLLYNNQKYWFALFDDATDYAKYDENNGYEDIGWRKRYAIIKLSEDQYEKAQYWHDLFYKYVAVYCTYDENEKLFNIFSNHIRGSLLQNFHHTYGEAHFHNSGMVLRPTNQVLFLAS